MEKLNFIKSKKSQVSTTLIIIAATPAILLMLIIYGFMIATIYSGKSQPSTEVQAGVSKGIAISGLTSFLNSDAGNGQTMYEMLSKTGSNDGKEAERKEIFLREGTRFLKNSFGEISYSSKLDLRYSEKDDIVNGYSIYELNNEELVGQSVIISVPILPDKKLNFLVELEQ